MSDVDRAIAEEVLGAAGGSAPVAVATVLRAAEGGPISVGDKLLVRLDGSRVGSLGGGTIEEAVAATCHAALTVRPRVQVESLHYGPDGTRLHRLEADSEGVEVMIEVTERPATLLVVGGGHVGHSVATIASHVGFSVVVLDDREAFANKERFPMADEVLCGDIVQELRRLEIDASTYIVLVSRGHKQDETALKEVAASDAAYVGMIGSRRRVTTVLKHLADEGVPPAALERVHTPIGLDIGGETPEEIAVSIVAEIVAMRRGGTGHKMSDLRKGRVGE